MATRVRMDFVMVFNGIEACEGSSTLGLRSHKPQVKSGMDRGLRRLGLGCGAQPASELFGGVGWGLGGRGRAAKLTLFERRGD